MGIRVRGPPCARTFQSVLRETLARGSSRPLSLSVHHSAKPGRYLPLSCPPFLSLAWTLGLLGSDGHVPSLIP